MRLRCLAGAYAGQIRDYSTVAGLAAVRTGMAAPIDPPASVVATVGARETRLAATAPPTPQRRAARSARAARE